MRALLLTFLTLFCGHASAQQESWRFLVYETSYTVGVRGVTKLDGGMMVFNLMTGYMPKGERLGFDRLVGATVVTVAHKCGQADAQFLEIWVRDTNMQLFKNVRFEKPQVVEVKGDRALEVSTEALCQQDGGESRFLRAQPESTDTITLVCKSNDTPQDLVLRFSPSRQTVNGRPAIVSETLVEVAIAEGSTSNILRLNRVTGQFTLETREPGFRVVGSCSRSTGKLF